MSTPRHYFAWIAVAVATVVYLASVAVVDRLPRPDKKELLRVAIPAPLQVLLAGGDRYLAANIAVFRALIAGTGQLDEETYNTLARVQMDAARLNPAHEDNYYIAQAILPWHGHVEADVVIQRAATGSRVWDAMPPFFLGFDQFYFLRNPVEGARSIELAARRSPPENRGYFTALAARWSEKGDDPRVAINMIRAMAENTRDREIKSHLEARIERLQGLALLQDAAHKFRAQHGRPPVRLDELVGPGLLVALPVDPLGQGFTLDASGVPIVVPPSLTKR